MNSENENWKGTSFEDAEMENLRAGARMTFREKLQWLEGAEQTAHSFACARVRVRDQRSGDWRFYENRETYLKARGEKTEKRKEY